MEPENVSEYLTPLLEHALHHIPPSQQSKTPIYVLATAGMRLIPEEKQAAILRQTCETIKAQTPFLLDSPRGDDPCGESVRIISGEEEGLWGWVAVNYLMDGFGHAPERQHPSGDEEHDHLLPLAPLALPPPGGSDDSVVTPVDINHHSPTFGFLDMGGASTQLAFSPSKEELSQSKFPGNQLSKVSLRLLSGELVEWPVFAASWLGFGTNKARDRYEDALVDDWKSKIEGQGGDRTSPVEDPCLPSGLVVGSADPSERPDIKGSGSFTQCLASLKPLLEHDKPCPTDHCLFGGMATPRIDFKRQDQRGFIGISEYWYTAQQVLGLGGVWDWGEWERGMSDFCAKDWVQIEDKVSEWKHHSDSVNLERLKLQCFKGAWISNVLHDGIGIPRMIDQAGNATLAEDGGDTNSAALERAREKGLIDEKDKQLSHFQSMDEVGATAISWTLGKIVIEASKAVGSNPYYSAGGTTILGYELRYGLWVYVLIAILLLVIVYNAFFRRRLRRKRPSMVRSKSLPVVLRGFMRPDTDAYEMVESGDTGKERPHHGISLTKWGRKVSNAIRGKGKSGMGFSNLGHGLPSSLSQPPSPNGQGSSSGDYFYNNRSASMMDMTRPPPSPPKGPPSRPPRSQSSAHVAPYSSAGGWNDPPSTMFASSTSTANRSPNLGVARAGDDENSELWQPIPRNRTLGDISRNSSRVNLSESMTMSMRSTSRATSPRFD